MVSTNADGLRSRQKKQSVNEEGENVGFGSSPLRQNKTHPHHNGGQQLDRIRFRHWLFMLSLVALFYILAIVLDGRMPNLVPDDDFERFSEVRARTTLNELASIGPRPSGSRFCEVTAVKVITKKLKSIQKTTSLNSVNRLDIDIQRPSSCYDLRFLSEFTSCYRNVTNIVARFGPIKHPKGAPHALLINAHFDTMPGTPGASDDAVSCAIMIDVLEVLAYDSQPLQHDIIFLFNGEENFLQASHGFITAHPWRHAVRAFINLEGAGAGGRELLFQAGPRNAAWLMKTYLDNVPYPHCSVVAQEVFQSGIFPSDTDFRVFRDYGRLSGLDIAYVKNGYVYHTEFDQEAFIHNGSVQRAGDNILALVRGLISSPYFAHPMDYHERKWVFFDVAGLFVLVYDVALSTVLNNCVVVLVLLKVLASGFCYDGTWKWDENGLIREPAYSIRDFVCSFVVQFFVGILVLCAGFFMATLISALNLYMFWYSKPWLIFPIYFLPAIMAGVGAHAVIVDHFYKARDPYLVEQSYFDATLALHAIILFVMTFRGLASASLLFIYTAFPLARDALRLVYKYFCKKPESSRSAKVLLWCHVATLSPVIFMCCYTIMLTFEIFVPVLGRTGHAFNPEFFISTLAGLAALTFVLYTSSLLYVSRRIWYLLLWSSGLVLLLMVLLALTRLGEPYKYEENSPRLRRAIILHTTRRLYDKSDRLASQQHGIFVQSLDYRGSDDMPLEELLTDASQKVNCSGIEDHYCRLPYYTALEDMLPLEFVPFFHLLLPASLYISCLLSNNKASTPFRDVRWIPTAEQPNFTMRIDLNLIRKEQLSDGRINVSFSVDGPDHMSLHVTPLDGYALSSWSLSEEMGSKFKTRRDTSFAFICYGHYSGPWNFWLVLKKGSNKNKVAEKGASQQRKVGQKHVDVTVASHHVHGAEQYSANLEHIRQLIIARRSTPSYAIGWWKWAMTPTMATAEVVGKYF